METYKMGLMMGEALSQSQLLGLNKLRTAIVLCDKRSITIRLKRGFARQSGLAIQFIELSRKPIKMG
ncbi:hypothetical protein [Helicobacter sp. 11S02596-1]|uniref:hypothetical protein n=1 Tax=Helicobacter sp. 11S02596-1 TaxID=1476194 RepID=UPI000BA57F3C|nr:hypothetical protein [Helicobacter sp. 11S02596-1]PAF44258.1 hypothetical protein BJI48_03505 [Helicobacter sp. 11S02596-1]